jgi:hypothetical protein
MKALVWSLAPIIGVQLLALAAALFVHIQAPGRGIAKLLVVPLALACLVASPLLFVQLMGFSVFWPLPQKFTFLAYQPIVKAGRKTDTEIWLREDGYTRLHRAPYSKELEQMLQEAQKDSKGGRQARITRKGKGKPGADSKSSMGGYELRFESPVDIPKEIPGAPPQAEPDEPITKRYSI